MPKISVIVPVYNVEAYIKECIVNVMNQSFTDWELLLINDGSTDLSGKICEEYANKDKRIKVIHKPNTGVSDTRNRGLDIAQGKYIIFLDADDYWYDYTVLEKLVETAEEYKLDIVRGEYKAVDKDGNDLFERPLIKSKKKFSGKLLTPGLFYTKIICGENFLVLSLIRKKAIGDLRLNRHRLYLEDMEFLAHLLCSSLRCMFIPLRFYAYRKHSQSASNTPNIKKIVDSSSISDSFDQCILKTDDEILRKAFRYYSIMRYYWTLESISENPYYSNRHEIIRTLSFVEKQKQTYIRIKQDRRVYPIHVYLSPHMGVVMLRYTNTLKRLAYHIYRECKSLLHV